MTIRKNEMFCLSFRSYKKLREARDERNKKKSCDFQKRKVKFD